MEAFLDDVYGPIEDYFENDYHLAAAKLLEKYQKGLESCQDSWC